MYIDSNFSDQFKPLLSCIFDCNFKISPCLLGIYQNFQSCILLSVHILRNIWKVNLETYIWYLIKIGCGFHIKISGTSIQMPTFPFEQQHYWYYPEDWRQHPTQFSWQKLLSENSGVASKQHCIHWIHLWGWGGGEGGRGVEGQQLSP